MKKIFSLLTLAFALLLVGCGSSQTNTDKSSSSADSSIKKELKISISIAPEGQEKSEKTVAVAEGKTAMDALKKAYKVALLAPVSDDVAAEAASDDAKK